MDLPDEAIDALAKKVKKWTYVSAGWEYAQVSGNYCTITGISEKSGLGIRIDEEQNNYSVTIGCGEAFIKKEISKEKSPLITKIFYSEKKKHAQEAENDSKKLKNYLGKILRK